MFVRQVSMGMRISDLAEPGSFRQNPKRVGIRFRGPISWLAPVSRVPSQLSAPCAHLMFCGQGSVLRLPNDDSA